MAKEDDRLYMAVTYRWVLPVSCTTADRNEGDRRSAPDPGRRLPQCRSKCQALAYSHILHRGSTHGGRNDPPLTNAPSSRLDARKRSNFHYCLSLRGHWPGNKYVSDYNGHVAS